MVEKYVTRKEFKVLLIGLIVVLFIIMYLVFITNFFKEILIGV